VLHLQHGFQLGEHNLPQSKHNAGSSGTMPQSGHCILIYLVQKNDKPLAPERVKKT